MQDQTTAGGGRRTIEDGMLSMPSLSVLIAVRPVTKGGGDGLDAVNGDERDPNNVEEGSTPVERKWRNRENGYHCR